MARSRTGRSRRGYGSWGRSRERVGLWVWVSATRDRKAEAGFWRRVRVRAPEAAFALRVERSPAPRPSPPRRYLFTVAQIFKLPYRRFAIGGTSLTGGRWQVRNQLCSARKTPAACCLSLLARNERGESWREGKFDKKCLLSPALSSFLRRRGRENAVARSMQIFCRTQLVANLLVARRVRGLSLNPRSADWQSAIQQAGSLRYEPVHGKPPRLFCRALGP